jgi:hypothetical protein
VKLAALGLSLVILILPFSTRADENLVAKREACRLEARTRIVPKTKIAVDDYRRIVERRNAHVSACMARAFAVVKEPPLPPRPAQPELAQAQRNTILAQARRNTVRWTTGSIKKRVGKGTSVKSSARKRTSPPVRRKRR